ncbi:MAG: hypothetical protein UU42_C0012G0014 [Candidatus Woesebacteria bacterium GW2011_GWA1_41_13b]|uniref:Uncharacterized protein n=1 Tax=Candidatus Woesebacteria bacterium GW2011_GWA1_41_13b TaxID=1618555 RepID=A0A0G0XU32_9BACT|nr:MAG: hypothetical protein UU42_C0012G0014 [Candidatus Woesebacteria bacterium GW2011_GWA1_41_13b]
MYNWNTDISRLKKNSHEFSLWRLNQLINFGLNGERLDLKQVKKHWLKIDTDPATKKFLKLII